MIGIILLLVGLLILNILSNSLTILVVSGILVTVSYKYKNFFRKAHWFYLGALVIAVLSMVFYQESVTYYVTKGLIAYGFFFVVMFVGALPNKWTVSRNIKRNRGVFSILGFIFITPHALLRVFSIIGVVNIFGIAAFVIMIPLTIISFQVIRREIDPKDWFRIQKAAYAIYGLLFVHLIMVAAWQDKIVYAVIATLYINNKVLKELKR